MDAGNDDKDIFRVLSDQPVVGKIRQHEAEHVLEYEEAGECFDGDLACGELEMGRKRDDTLVTKRKKREPKNRGSQR